MAKAAAKQAPPPPTPAEQAVAAIAANARPHPRESDTGPVVPTHSCIRVRNSHDAHVIMEAVRLDLLPLINRRLTPAQRKELGANGSVFVWEKVEHPNGLRRWDDSLRWRPGLNISPFEIFEERGEIAGVDRKNAKTRPDRNAGRPKGTSYLRPSRRSDMPAKTNGMTRQVYTADMQTAQDPAPRRWHLVCYYRKSELDMVPTVEQDRMLARVRVPAGVYRSVTKNIRSLKNPVPVLTIPGETDVPISPSTNESHPPPPPQPTLDLSMLSGPGIPFPPPMLGPVPMGMIPPPPPHLRHDAQNGKGRAREVEANEDEEMDEGEGYHEGDEEEDEEEEDDSDDNRGPYGPRSARKAPPPPNKRGRPPKPKPASGSGPAPRASVSYVRGESFARGEPPLTAAQQAANAAAWKEFAGDAFPLQLDAVRPPTGKRGEYPGVRE